MTALRANHVAATHPASAAVSDGVRANLEPCPTPSTACPTRRKHVLLTIGRIQAGACLAIWTAFVLGGSSPLHAGDKRPKLARISAGGSVKPVAHQATDDERTPAIKTLAGEQSGSMADDPLREPNNASSNDRPPRPLMKSLPADDEALSLDECLDLAERFNPILARELARINSASGNELQAGLWSNPRFDTNNPQVFAGRNSLFNAGVQQEIPVAGKKRLDREAAGMATRQAQANLNVTRYALFGAVRSQFYQTLAAQQRVSLYPRLTRLTARAVETAHDRYKKGVGNNIDVQLLRADYERVLAGRERAEALLRGERQQLAQLIGRPELAELKADGDLFAPPPKFDEQQLKDFITTQSETIRIAQLEIERNRILARRAEVEWIPNPTIGPAYQWGVQQGGADQFWFNITFPIPTNDRNQGNILATRADIQVANANLTATQLDLLRAASDLHSRHQAALRQAERYRTEVLPSTREALDLARDGFRGGLLPTASFLQAQRTFVETYLGYIDLLEDVWTTAADLSRLMQVDEFP